MSSAHGQRIVRSLHAKLVKQNMDPNVAAVTSFSLLQRDPFLGCDSLVDLDNAIGAQEPFGGESAPRLFLAISLSEAETIRRVLHTPRVKAHKQTLVNADVALRCIDSFASEGHILDRSPRYGPGRADAAKEAVQTFRFFNNEFYYTPEEINVLLGALEGSVPEDRLAHFEHCLRLRRRERNLWDDTPIAKLFTDEKDWHLLSARAKVKHLIDAMKRGIKTRTPPLDPIALFSSFDERGGGVLKASQLTRCLESMQLGFSPADVGIVVSTLLGERESMTYEDYISAFRLESFVEMMEKRQRDEEERHVASMRQWQCTMCSYINQACSPQCDVCGHGANGYVVEVPRDKWMCDPSRGGCSFFNEKSLFYCQMCERSRPDLATARF